MKIFSVIRTVIASFFKKKKSESGFHAGEFPLSGVPGEHGLYQQKKNGKLSGIKQLFRRKKRIKNEGYGRPVTRGKLLQRCTVLFLCISAAGLFYVYGDKTALEKGFDTVSFFQVSEVVFSGCRATSRDQLREQAGIVLHQTNLMGLDTDQVKRDLEDNPWVSGATVKRNWPSTVEIVIKEHVPVALLHFPAAETDQLYYIDKKGASFMPVPIGANLDFPVITGLAEIEIPALKKKALAEILLFLQKVGINDPHLPAQSVSEVHVNPIGELVVYLVEYPFPIFFGNGNTKQKYQKLIRVLRALYKKERGEEIISSVEYIRMDYFNDKVLVAQSGSG
ncbi:MAG: FtsQ-type POTRA domain-containing protein [Desulfobulbaceae bacterium]|nr:FtsQ-type POTRA domain-containing protein [Desulfobulbaceae bacterium]